MHKITPFLWFDNNAEEAAKFYTSVFKNAKILSVSRYGDGAPMPKGTAMTVSLEIDGQEVMLLNGGPYFKFTEAVSMIVTCNTQGRACRRSPSPRPSPTPFGRSPRRSSE